MSSLDKNKVDKITSIQIGKMTEWPTIIGNVSFLSANIVAVYNQMVSFEADINISDAFICARGLSSVTIRISTVQAKFLS